MKKFLAIYIGYKDGQKVKAWEALTPEARQERQRAGIASWHAFVKQNEGSIVAGGPLGKTLSVTEQGVEPTRNDMMAYTIIQAESHEAAAERFMNHPHFSHFPGDAIEIMDCSEIPVI